MADESRNELDFGSIDRGLRIDCVLASAAQRTEAINYETAIVSDNRVFSTVTYRDGVAVSAEVILPRDGKPDDTRTADGYLFQSTPDGWRVSERLMKSPGLIDFEDVKLAGISEGHVALLEDVIGSGTTVGFNSLSPTNQQRFKTVKSAVRTIFRRVLVFGPNATDTNYDVRK